MSVNEMETKIARLQEWEAIAEEAKAEAEALRDEIKAEMLSRDTEEMEAGRFIIRWTSVLSNRFDTTSFKKELIQQRASENGESVNAFINRAIDLLLSQSKE